MAPPRKTIQQYEREATKVGKCLIHPSSGIARKIYKMRHNIVLPSNIAVCHKCDIPKCIRDSHHFLGTWKDNVQDSVRKGRHSCFRKGGVRNSGPHTDVAKALISAASTRLWQSFAYRKLIKRKLKLAHDAKTAEELHAIGLKRWATRRARYGGNGRSVV